ncbi:MAG: tetratricopeptide repeat protein [Zavarzinella sp.]
MSHLMHKVLVVGLLLITVPTFYGAEPTKEELTKTVLELNRLTGTTSMTKRLVELARDEQLSKKLIPVAVELSKAKKRDINYNALFVMGRLAQNFKLSDDAVQLYRAASEEATKVGSASKIVDVFDSLIDLYAATKKYDEAIQACQEFLEIPIDDPESPISRMKPFIMEKMVMNVARKGKIDEAVALADRLVEDDRGGWYFVRLKGDVLREGEKYKEAAEAYELSLSRLKKFDRLEKEQRDRIGQRIRYILSSVYVSMKDLDKGITILEELVKEDPKNPTYLNDLGFTLADHDKRLDDAEKLIRQAIEFDREERKAIENLPKDLDVDNAAYLDSLGWVLFKKKKYQEALKELEAAVKLEDGAHIEIYDHLAETYKALGQTNKAVEMWKKALKLEDISKSDQERRKAIQKKLDSNRDD